jgi:hypothetical protein
VASTWHHFGGKFNWYEPKNGAQIRAHGLENPDVSEGPRLSLPFFSLFFIVFIVFKVFFSLVFEVEIVQEWKTLHGWRKTLLSVHPHSIFEHMI